MIGIIGGSGFYNFIEEGEIKETKTPFGTVKYVIGWVGEKETCFIPRHGAKHSVPPAQINYQANIFAINSLGADYIIATNAVGSTSLKFKPGSFAAPNGIMDFTSGRKSTYFDNSGIEITLKSGEKISGVVHTDVTEALSTAIRKKIIQAGAKLGHEVHDGGTIVVTNGPRFETPSEIKAYGLLGADFAGMTSAPEVFLAKELKIPYATLVVVTNYGAGLQSSVSAEEVFELFAKRIEVIKNIFRTIITN